MLLLIQLIHPKRNRDEWKPFSFQDTQNYINLEVGIVTSHTLFYTFLSRFCLHEQMQSPVIE